jgi:hypothetical protein
MFIHLLFSPVLVSLQTNIPETRKVCGYKFFKASRVYLNRGLVFLNSKRVSKAKYSLTERALPAPAAFVFINLSALC